MNDEQGDGRQEPICESEQAPPDDAAEDVRLSFAEYEELKTLARERDDYLRRLQRAVADFQNLQKRTGKLRAAVRPEITRAVVERILPVADSLALALDAAECADVGPDILEGLRLVEKEFYEALAGLDVRPINAAGDRFDPHYHEAAMQEEADDLPPGTVVRELKKGFLMGGVVIRASQVTVTPEKKQPDAGQRAPDDGLA